jgi:hypothetical protein
MKVLRNGLKSRSELAVDGGCIKGKNVDANKKHAEVLFFIYKQIMFMRVRKCGSLPAWVMMGGSLTT